MGSHISRFPVGSGSRSRVTWPQKPAQVVVQRRGSLNDTEPEKISLRALIETQCPSVLIPFKAAWWLFKSVLSLLPYHPSSLGKPAVATCRPDMQSSAIFLKQIRWCMTGSSPYCPYFGRNDYNLHRKLLGLKDGGTLHVYIFSSCQSTNQHFFCSGVDFTPPAAAGRVFDKTTPVVVALHGLTGGALMKHSTQSFLI